MQASIVSVGTELLFGQIVNTNAAYLSEQLNRMGIDVMYHFTVGDNPKRLEEILEEAMNRTDLVITTGGLGPTQDDLTKEVVCRVMEDELILHQPSLDAMAHFFSLVKRPMTENNLKQAYLPKRATILPNQMGTAPGFASVKGTNTIACLPGPPREMKAMFESALMPFLSERIGSTIYYRLIRTYGIGESALETALIDLIDGQTDPTIATYAMEGECYLRITSKRSAETEARQQVNAMLEQVLQRVGDFVYSCDGEDLVEVVAKKLMATGTTLSCAESCTGGLFASTLTQIPGISACFDRGYITYSNQAKINDLGVSPVTISKYGAVSSETAREMVYGLHKATGSRVCVAVTGISGPDGGTDEKPVGLTYIALLLTTESGQQAIYQEEKHIIANHRQKHRTATVLAMLAAVNKIL